MNLICRSTLPSLVGSACDSGRVAMHAGWLLSSRCHANAALVTLLGALCVVTTAVTKPTTAFAAPVRMLQESFDSAVELPESGEQFQGDLFDGQADTFSGEGMDGMDVEFDTGEFEEFGSEDFSPPEFDADQAAWATFSALIGGLVCGAVPALLLGGLIGFWLGRRTRRTDQTG